jgi:TolB-like protein/Tfp pilus assembly protein PilF
MTAGSNGGSALDAAAVFLSYASQDQEAAERICESLQAAGVEVWLDKSGLRGGDAWDATIRRQIKSCDLFIPVISRNTQARAEGYFRLEWKLAIDRSHLMSSTRAFLLPVVIDDTRDNDDSVPERFREVQWTRLPAGHASSDFAARVLRLLSGEAAPVPRAAATVSAASPSDTTTSAPPLSATTRAPPPRRPLLLWTSLTLALLAVAYLGVDRVVAPRPTPPASDVPAASDRAPAAAADRSIAVLPFVDMSEKRDQEYFSDGLAEELLDRLAKTPGLRVIARTSSFYFKGKSATIPEMARTLGVTNILEGSVRTSGHRLRITTQLIRADTGVHLWSETYDRNQEDVFKIQDDIAQSVVEKLRVTLIGAETPRPDATAANPQAHSLFLKGRFLLSSDMAEGLSQAKLQFESALKLDPEYAPAWASLALVAQRQVANGYVPVAEGIAREVAAARKAVELAPAYSDGFVQLGRARVMADFDWAGARKDVEHAVDIEPSNADAQFALAYLTVSSGRPEDGLRSLLRLLDRDPLNLLHRRYVARGLYYAGRLDEAEAMLHQVVELNPAFPAAHYELGRVALARGQVSQAMDEFEKEHSAWRFFGLPLGYHAQGRAADEAAAMKQLVDNSAGSEFQVAEAYANRGEVDQAFTWLDRAVERRDPGIQWLRGDPLLRNLTRDPRYVALLRRLNLPS